MSDLDRLRLLFEANRGRKIPSYRVMALAPHGGHTKRISELRKLGYRIECRRGPKTATGRVTSEYRCL